MVQVTFIALLLSCFLRILFPETLGTAPNQILADCLYRERTQHFWERQLFGAHSSCMKHWALSDGAMNYSAMLLGRAVAPNILLLDLLCANKRNIHAAHQTHCVWLRFDTSTLRGVLPRKRGCGLLGIPHKCATGCGHGMVYLLSEHTSSSVSTYISITCHKQRSDVFKKPSVSARRR